MELQNDDDWWYGGVRQRKYLRHSVLSQSKRTQGKVFAKYMSIYLYHSNDRWASTATVRYKCYIHQVNFATYWIKKLYSFYSWKKHIFGIIVWYQGTIERKHIQMINRLCTILLYYVYVMAKCCHLIAWITSYAINVLCVWHMPLGLHYPLIHWGRGKMDDTLKRHFQEQKFMNFD